MPSTHISDARGLTHSGGSGLHITNEVTITGNTRFLGSVSGVTADVTSRFSELNSPAGTVDYDCSNSTRYFRHAAPPAASWNANFTGLSLQKSQGATVKLAIVTSETTECFIEDVFVDGSPVASFITSSMYGLKIRKGGKHGIVTFDLMRNESGEIHVYADISQDLVP
jgi:hypothetical protein